MADDASSVDLSAGVVPTAEDSSSASADGDCAPCGDAPVTGSAQGGSIFGGYEGRSGSCWGFVFWIALVVIFVLVLMKVFGKGACEYSVLGLSPPKDWYAAVSAQEHTNAGGPVHSMPSSV